jgi:hypothetical protein
VKQGDQWVYLQSGGAIGAQGTETHVQVRLPAPLQHYRALPSAHREDTIRAVRASLEFLLVAPDRISVPLLRRAGDVARIVKKLAVRAGLDAAKYAGHFP